MTYEEAIKYIDKNKNSIDKDTIIAVKAIKERTKALADILNSAVSWDGAGGIDSYWTCTQCGNRYILRQIIDGVAEHKPNCICHPSKKELYKNI